MRHGQWRSALQTLAGYHWGEWWFSRGLRAIQSRSSEPLLILHPQTLGFRNFIRLVERRSAPATLYLLDSSFFCVASYNHLSEEYRPCERCVGGDFEQAHQHECKPFPKPDSEAYQYVGKLREFVMHRQVVIVAQNERQAELAQRHFGLAELPPVVGLWTDDWDSLIDTTTEERVPTLTNETRVVFHGYDLEAKGARWLEKVAEHVPGRTFLFPFHRPHRRSPPANCQYTPMTWETGLQDAVRAAPCVVVPSLWSAPIEGSLVKSVALSRCVAVTENPSSYADELPSGLVLKLPREPMAAGAALDRALSARWEPKPELKADWRRRLAHRRSEFLQNLLSAVCSAAS